AVAEERHAGDEHHLYGDDGEQRGGEGAHRLPGRTRGEAGGCPDRRRREREGDESTYDRGKGPILFWANDEGECAHDDEPGSPDDEEPTQHQANRRARGDR